ncbi:MAG: ABC transporter permease [Clostridiales bacterium]|nr:ABC transporter permease [Clostridiales bacterium]
MDTVGMILLGLLVALALVIYCRVEAPQSKKGGPLSVKRFLSDLRRYKGYIFYSAKCSLKDEVAGSFLNWAWLILNPVMFMLVYAFVQIVVFGGTTQYLAAFVFIGMASWNFFNACVSGSVRTIKRYEGIISKVYVPKFVFILSNMLVNGFKLLVAIGLIFISMIVYQVPPSWTMLWFIPLLLLLFLLTFGISCILMHTGVFVDDMASIVPIVLRLLFFISGIFYDLEGKLEGMLGVLVERFNPMAFIIAQSRHVLLYGEGLDLGWFFIWLAIGLVLSAIGVSLIYRYERRYVKTV